MPAANFWWGMIWEDPRTVDLIESNTLSDPTYICQAWCSTEQGTDILLEELGVPNNSTGQATFRICLAWTHHQTIITDFKQAKVWHVTITSLISRHNRDYQKTKAITSLEYKKMILS